MIKFIFYHVKIFSSLENILIPPRMWTHSHILIHQCIHTVYTPNKKAAISKKQKLTALKCKRGKSTIKVEHFKSPFSATKQKTNKNTELNNTINKQELIDICRTIHSTTAEYTLFLSVYGTHIKIDYILGHKTNL